MRPGTMCATALPANLPHSDHLDDGACAVCVQSVQTGFSLALTQYKCWLKRLSRLCADVQKGSLVRTQETHCAVECRLCVPLPASARAARARRCHARRARAPHARGINSDCATQHVAQSSATACGTPRRTGMWTDFPPASSMRALHLGAAAGEHDAGKAIWTSSKPLRAQLLAHQSKQFLVARSTISASVWARQAPRRHRSAHRSHLDALVRVGELRQVRRA